MLLINIGTNKGTIHKNALQCKNYKHLVSISMISHLTLREQHTPIQPL